MVQIDEKKYKLHIKTSGTDCSTVIMNRNTYQLVFECRNPIDVIQISKGEKDYFMALSRANEAITQIPSVIFSNELTNSSIQIPMFSECLIDEITGLQQVSYSIDEMPCIEISVPVKFSNIEDCLTYIFYKECDSESNFPFVGVVSSYLDSFVKPSASTNLASHSSTYAGHNCTSSEDLRRLIEEAYLKKMYFWDQVLTFQKKDERNKFFEKSLGSRFKQS